MEPGTPARPLNGPSRPPQVGVVVVNYNGGDLTLRCLRSVLRSHWPADALRVVLVDNGSHDGMAARVRRELPTVEVIDPGRNLGFAGGCNVGLQRLAAAEYVALLNNDAHVDPAWLRPLVEALESDPTVGAACPKILFDDVFVELSIRPATVRGAGTADRRSSGVALGGVRAAGAAPSRAVQLVSGFWGTERLPPHGEPYRWTKGEALLRVATRTDGTLPACSLRLWSSGERAVVITSGDASEELVVGPEPAWSDVRLGGPAVDVVNNAGSELVVDGYGADRGYQERDVGQYERTAEVFAWCGAAVLLSRRYVEAVGMFAERFFLYYEDFDLSWRGRAQGWSYLYVPGPPVRHVHSAATVAGSRLHDHYSERNRLLTLTRNAPGRLVVTAAGRHLWDTARYARRDVVVPMTRRQPASWETVRRRSGAFAAYLAALAPTLPERRQIRRRQKVPDADVLRWATSP